MSNVRTSTLAREVRDKYFALREAMEGRAASVQLGQEVVPGACGRSDAQLEAAERIYQARQVLAEGLNAVQRQCGRIERRGIAVQITAANLLVECMMRGRSVDYVLTQAGWPVTSATQARAGRLYRAALEILADKWGLAAHREKKSGPAQILSAHGLSLEKVKETSINADGVLAEHDRPQLVPRSAI